MNAELGSDTATSYSSVDDYRTYLDTVSYEHEDVSDDELERVLELATAHFDTIKWAGHQTWLGMQALAWPRVVRNAVTGYKPPIDVIPVSVLRVFYNFTYRLMTDESALDAISTNASTVSSVKIDDVAITYTAQTQRTPIANLLTDADYNLIRGYIATQGRVIK